MPNALSICGFALLLLIALTSCAPFYMRESEKLSDPRLRRVYESYRLIDVYYVEKIDALDLEQRAVEGVLKAIANGEVTVSPDTMDSLERLRKEENKGEPFHIISDAFHLIQRQTVSNVNLEAMMDGAIRGMLELTDTLSVFYSPEEVQLLSGDDPAGNAAVGLRLGIKNRHLTVIASLEESPAERAGIREGDQIVMIDRQPTDSLKLIEAVRYLRGPVGSQVILTIEREDAPPFDLTIIREPVRIKNVRQKVYSTIGYVRLASFHESVTAELRAVLEDLSGKGMTALILDLRNNPGGLLNEAVTVSELFLHKGSLIAYITGRNNSPFLRFSVQGQPIFPTLPIVVLVNKGSAAGSEILAGALQDWHRAVIIGERTFGGTSIQTAIPLSDGSVLKLTTGRFHTPKDTLIQDVGLSPDIAVEVNPTESDELKTFGDIDSDTLLQKAVEVIKQRDKE